MSTSETLSRALDFFEGYVRPRAEAIDRDPAALGEALDEMGRRGLLAMKRPEKYGGPNLPDSEYRLFQEESARVSGALSFLMTQHQSAVSLIAKSDNEALKSALLPKMGSGEVRVGVGFSQLRRPGTPLLAARSADGGYYLTGEVPWVTGFGFFESFIAGARLPDGRALFAVVPLGEEPGVFHVSPPMELAVFGSTHTVSVTVQDAWVPNEAVLFVKPADWAETNDLINIVLQGHFAIGCARAGLDIVHSEAKRKGLPFLDEADRRLRAELDHCRETMQRVQATGYDETTEEKLRVRAWAIELAVRCAHAAVAASSGQANQLSHPAQRVYREALVYTVSAQTTAIMEATLNRLVR